jgi:hypothetical protein
MATNAAVRAANKYAARRPSAAALLARRDARDGGTMARMSGADRLRILFSSRYMIAFVFTTFALWATWMAAILLEELGP